MWDISVCKEQQILFSIAFFWNPMKIHIDQKAKQIAIQKRTTTYVAI